jgi:hypothetical protein
MAMVAFTALASVAVDLGHVRVVKTQLQSGADAAARYGATTLLSSVSNAVSNAVSAASRNSADGTAISLNTNTDVQLGTWNSSTTTFTVLTGAAVSNANAVRVYARRTAATGNAVSLFFATLIGKSSFDVTATATAAAKPSGYGIIGINSISLSGNSTDSYWSPNGNSTGGAFGSIASNGDITLGGSASINGSAHPGAGHAVSNPSAVTGSTSPLASPLSYPNANAGSYATTNDDANAPSSYMASNNFHMSSGASLTLPGGVYYFNSFSMSGNATLSFSGPATLYIHGNLSLAGGASTYANLPTNLKIYMCPDASGNPPGDISITGGASLYAQIYAPQSNISLGGNGAIYGSVLGLTVSSSGTSAIHYDASLDGPGGASLVQ